MTGNNSQEREQPNRCELVQYVVQGNSSEKKGCCLSYTNWQAPARAISCRLTKLERCLFWRPNAQDRGKSVPMLGSSCPHLEIAKQFLYVAVRFFLFCCLGIFKGNSTSGLFKKGSMQITWLDVFEMQGNPFLLGPYSYLPSLCECILS